MKQLEQIVLPQNGETPLQHSLTGKFNYSFAYSRSTDSQQTDTNGEDYLTFRTDGNRFVFVLCDGVGSSFMGDLSSKFLGERLCEYLDKLNMKLSADEINSRLTRWLNHLTFSASRLVRTFPLPEPSHSRFKNEWESKRKHGSQTTFTAGVIDLAQDSAWFASIGNSPLRIWNNAIELDLSPHNPTSVRQVVWSSQRGIIGNLYVFGLLHASVDFDYLVVYSDGFHLIGNTSNTPNQQLAAIDESSRQIGQAHCYDDVSFLKIQLNEFVSTPYNKIEGLELYIPEFFNVSAENFLNVSYRILWFHNEAVSHYEIKFLSADLTVISSYYCKYARWEGRIFERGVRFISVRAWQGGHPGKWNTPVKLPLFGTTTLAPPPLAAPPPKLLNSLYLLFGLIVAIAIILIMSMTSTPSVLSQAVISPFWIGTLTFIKGLTVSLLFIFIPSLAARITKTRSRVTQSIAEIVLFSIVLMLVEYLMFKQLGSSWLVYSIAIVSVLDAGGHALDHVGEERLNRSTKELESKQRQLDKKKKNTKQTQALLDDISQYTNMLRYVGNFNEIFNQERLLYLALPLGILSGVSVGLYKQTSTIGYVEYTIQHISIIAAIVLTYFVYRAILQMVLPVYISQWLRREKIVFTSDELDKFQDEKERAIGLGKTTTDLRELFLYDSVHNVLLLSVFLYVFLASINISLSWKEISFGVLFMLTVFSQLPFIIGQSLLRQYILNGYGGYARGVMESELKKDEYAPLLRKPEFLVALTTLGTGGLLFILAENFIKELFK